ncbi:MAG: PAC2 family protein, partial [Candidatus Bilamarchaeaceae archaeon]
QVLMSRKGTMRLIKNAFYMYNAKKFDLIILVGDIQAMSSVGQYEVAGKILDYAKKLGVKKIIAVGGYSTGVVTEKRRIFGVVTAPEEINELKKMGVVFGEAKGSIVGSAGLIPALGALRGIKGICLLGETHGGYVDTITAKEVVALLSTYLGIEINLKKIDERAKKSEKIIKRLEEEIKRNIETSFGQEPSKISYIR